MSYPCDASLVRGVFRLPKQICLEAYHFIWHKSVVAFEQCGVDVLAVYGNPDLNSNYGDLNLAEAFEVQIFHDECVQHLYDCAQFLVRSSFDTLYHQYPSLPFSPKFRKGQEIEA